MSNSFPTAAPASLQAALNDISDGVLNRCQGVLEKLEYLDKRRNFKNGENTRQLRKLELLLTAEDIKDDPVTWTSLSNKLLHRPAGEWKVANLIESQDFGSFRHSFKELCDKQKREEMNVADNLLRRANREVPEVVMTDAESVASTVTLGSVAEKLKWLNLAGGNDATSVGSATATKLKILNKYTNMISNRESVNVPDLIKASKRLSQMQAMEFAAPYERDSFYRSLNEEILIEERLSLKLARDSRRSG
eukprot:CAMPEP_0171334964 /NCGR_PEP_ID=MMETSP0878-20121228/5040_1 /TAXON_ID=67004 /ORGANISM="Thalassiosira weissflogii, Strain CCMP1336" /LENGTH=248 /DNA_ID=CAMNT_0011836173 /DNA_START=170 /DNA_END=916 /DNA_ORIENTATION=+